MKNRIRAMSTGILICIIAFNVLGCSKLSSSEPPTNADIIKAVIDHELGEKCNIIPTTLVIVEKGSRKEDGSWPYKVHFTCVAQSATAMMGKLIKVDKQLSLNLYKSEDSAGKTVWTAR